jgi:transposase-like protein
VLNKAQYLSDVITLVVRWRLRYRLTLRDLNEMFLLRDIVFSYEAVRDWEPKLTPLPGRLSPASIRRVSHAAITQFRS